MPPRIDKKLNLIVTVDTDDGPVYVHSTPISRQVFEQFYLVISKAFAGIYGEGLNIIAGPRIAMLMLRDIARQMGQLEGPGGVEIGLIKEAYRLTNVVMPRAEGGWKTVPFQEVVDRELLSRDDIAEVEGVLAFFICASSMHRREQLPAILDGIASLWEARTTSLNSTEYAASLPTSIEAETTPTTISSVPS